MTDQDIWEIWDEVVDVDMGFDPVPFARAILNAAPGGDIEHVTQVLACEIECGVFEQHVAPALEIARKVLPAPTQGADARPVPYLASLDCPYSSVSEDIKCAWADGWNQCVQATGSSTRVRMPKINFSALYMRLFNSKNFRELEWKDVSEQSGVGSVPITRLAMGRSIEKQHVDKLIDWLENSSPMPFEKGADTRPVASDAHAFALMCDALPVDFNWGDPLTPDVFRHIESVLATRAAAPSDVTAQALAEIERLNAIINTPHADDFMRAVSIEAEHQRQRWGAEGDAGKTPADWFWLIGYLAGKALHAHAAANTEKCEHHIITTAAACANWHRALFGKTDMRPGHEEGTAMLAAATPREKT